MRRLVVVVGLCWLQPISWAATPPTVELLAPSTATASELAQLFESSESDPLDAWHDRMFLALQRSLERFDTRQAESLETRVPVPISPFRIGGDLRVVDTADANGQDVLRHNFIGDFDISLRLPNLQSRLNLFLTTDSLDERAAVERWESIRAGFRLALPQAVDFEVGARLSTPLAAFVALRWGQQREIGPWSIEPFAKIFLETDDGAGASTALIASRWQGNWLLRSAGSIRWLAEEDTTQWSQTVLLAKVQQMLGADRFSSRNRGRDLLASSGLRLEARGERLSRTDTYQASLLFKRPLHSNWLFWSIEPSVSYERRTGWQADPGIRLGVDLLFWDLAAR